MKKPDSPANQLKTIQSERNLARGSKHEIESGAVNLEASPAHSNEVFSCRSISRIAAMVVSRRRDFCQIPAAWQYRLASLCPGLAGIVLVLVRESACD